MAGAYALRDEIIAQGDAQSAVFTSLFEKLVENMKKEEMDEVEQASHSKEVRKS